MSEGSDERGRRVSVLKRVAATVGEMAQIGPVLLIPTRPRPQEPSAASDSGADAADSQPIL